MSMICEWENRWLGIDFSGNHLQWRARCKSSNIWIAHVQRCETLVLVKLTTVQRLSGEGDPFQKLTSLLASKEFNAAAIDAPFSVPSSYTAFQNHRELLKAVSEMERPNGRCFPCAPAFVKAIVSDRAMRIKKPLRETERYWQTLGVNVRSTLWAGARGGAAMTSACLTLLQETECPIWPWNSDGPGLLVEAFPAAQLRHWELPHQKYNGKGEVAQSNRQQIVRFLRKHLKIRAEEQHSMESSADALDAVVCAFAAIAVTTRRSLKPKSKFPTEEGRIAIHRRLPIRLQNAGN